MRRTLAVLAGAVLAGSFAAVPAAAAPQAAAAHPQNLMCAEGSPLCAEPLDSIGYEGRYTGHDEPSVLFYSRTPGAGNNAKYQVVVPKDPPARPKNDGTGGTFNFQTRIALWFGMDLCDNQSGPEFTHAACVPNSDSNIFDGTDPTKADYIGHHPGTAFLELQFYPPGWAPFVNGISCDAKKWCAAMAIFSFNSDQNNGINNNADCLGKVGLEPANFAFVTLNGKPHAPAGPLNQTTDTFTPSAQTDLFMGAGDNLTIDIHDSSAGLVTAIRDHTTGQSGSMTASVGNGFAQVNFQPNATTCSQTPYAFHPMYSSSSEHTRVPWAAHSYNVAFSDEIGHFENCANVTADATCADANPPASDTDDVACHTAQESLRIQISGCTGSDSDFDGKSYQKVWPGSQENPVRDFLFNPRSIEFTSPTFNGGRNYERVGFEADMPRIEAADFGGNCNRVTGANCVNPPPGAAFYPLYTTRNDHESGCAWQLGGTHIPGTTNTFGGTSTTEFGSLLFLSYPNTGNTVRTVAQDFRQVLPTNPCVNRH